MTNGLSFLESLMYLFVPGLPTTETDVLSQLDEPRPPQINIGRDHQADIPELCNDRIDLHRVPEQLLWDPGINDALDDNEGIRISTSTFSY